MMIKPISDDSIVALARSVNTLPEFVPLPPPRETEFYSGLKRGKLNQLILPSRENGYRPVVKSISLRPSGCRKGKRLIHLQSLLKYLRAQLGAGNDRGRVRPEGDNE